MESNDIEKLVKRVVREQTRDPNHCLSDPCAISFYKKTKDILLGYLKNAHAKITRSASSEWEVLLKFRQCLDVMRDWDAGMQEAEMEKIAAQFPTIKKEFTYTGIMFLKKLQSSNDTLRVPLFKTFFLKLMHDVVMSREVRDMHIFRMSHSEFDQYFLQHFCNCIFMVVDSAPQCNNALSYASLAKSELRVEDSVSNAPAAAASVAVAEEDSGLTVQALEDHIKNSNSQKQEAPTLRRRSRTDASGAASHIRRSMQSRANSRTSAAVKILNLSTTESKHQPQHQSQQPAHQSQHQSQQPAHQSQHQSQHRRQSQQQFQHRQSMVSERAEPKKEYVPIPSIFG